MVDSIVGILSFIPWVAMSLASGYWKVRSVMGMLQRVSAFVVGQALPALHTVPVAHCPSSLYYDQFSRVSSSLLASALHAELGWKTVLQNPGVGTSDS